MSTELSGDQLRRYRLIHAAKVKKGPPTPELLDLGTRLGVMLERVSPSRHAGFQWVGHGYRKSRRHN